MCKWVQPYVNWCGFVTHPPFSHQPNHPLGSTGYDYSSNHSHSPQLFGKRVRLTLFGWSWLLNRGFNCFLQLTAGVDCRIEGSSASCKVFCYKYCNSQSFRCEQQPDLFLDFQQKARRVMTAKSIESIVNSSSVVRLQGFLWSFYILCPFNRWVIYLFKTVWRYFDSMAEECGTSNRGKGGNSVIQNFLTNWKTRNTRNLL